MADVGQIDVQAIVDDLRATVEQTYRGQANIATVAKAFEITGKITSVLLYLIVLEKKTQHKGLEFVNI